MEPHKVALLVGLAAGAYLGYCYAGRLVAYPPYSQLARLIMPHGPRMGPVIVNPTLGDQIRDVGAGVSGVVNTVTDALGALEGLFGSNSVTSPTGEPLYYAE